MTEMVAEKTKRISRKSSGKQVRLWVRARFLGFKRYIISNFQIKSSTKYSSKHLEIRRCQR